jgi:hypothetical protein
MRICRILEARWRGFQPVGVGIVVSRAQRFGQTIERQRQQAG